MCLEESKWIGESSRDRENTYVGNRCGFENVHGKLLSRLVVRGNNVFQLVTGEKIVNVISVYAL